MYGIDINRINQQIKDLEQMKNNFMANQQPIQNIINTNTPQTDFEARYANENDNVDEIIVQRRTAFISPKNGYLKIKEINGDITTYELVIPKTAEQLKIEELERRLEMYERANNTTNYEVSEQRDVNNADDEPTTKTSGRGISKKS